jgi:large subunit ribosomal protein L15
MNLSTIKRPRRASENRKRIGRGMGSGMGKTSTRGHKGQGSRSGSRLLRGFEGGQMPLHRRLPKRGFTNIFRKHYAIVNLARLAELGEKEITPELLRQRGVVSSSDPVKILGDGDLSSALTVRAHKFSESAREKITKAGGTCELISTNGATSPVIAKPEAKQKSATAKHDAPAKAKEKKPKSENEKTKSQS